MKKIWLYVKYFFENLFGATKNTETTFFTQAGVDEANGGITITQDVNQYAHALSKALLRGELTEEVKQLRYRTYLVDRESKKYKYFSPTLALRKKNGKNSKFVKYENEDNLEVITIQECHNVGEGILEGITQAEGEQRGKKAQYNIEITRMHYPRFRMEEFMKRVVVKRVDEDHFILDFYFSKYPERFFLTSEDKSFRSKVFIHEIERVKDEGIRSEMLEINGVYFVTNHAYNYDDLFEFSFDNLYFQKVVEYDGDYILRYKARSVIFENDLTQPFYNKEMDEKYQTNAPKEVPTLSLTGECDIIEYICDECGRKVTFDTKKMGEMPMNEARDIDEEINDDENDWNVTEYFDMQIIEQTIGKKLCKNCLKKYIEKREIYDKIEKFR